MTTTTSPTMLASGEYAQGDAPLPSWNEGPTKQSIVNFVRGVTTAGSPQFVKPEERIAIFDNDGTLWSEMPLYFQFAFVLDRMKVLAPQHPEWKDNPLYAAVLEDRASYRKRDFSGTRRGLDDLPRELVVPLVCGAAACFVYCC